MSRQVEAAGPTTPKIFSLATRDAVWAGALALVTFASFVGSVILAFILDALWLGGPGMGESSEMSGSQVMILIGIMTAAGLLGYVAYHLIPRLFWAPLTYPSTSHMYLAERHRAKDSAEREHLQNAYTALMSLPDSTGKYGVEWDEAMKLYNSIELSCIKLETTRRLHDMNLKLQDARRDLNFVVKEIETAENSDRDHRR